MPNGPSSGPSGRAPERADCNLEAQAVFGAAPLSGRLFTGPATNPIKQQKSANEEWKHSVKSVTRRV